MVTEQLESVQNLMRLVSKAKQDWDLSRVIECKFDSAEFHQIYFSATVNLISYFVS
jgi:hypothetical protein